MTKLENRGIKKLVQNHTAEKIQSWDSNPEISEPRIFKNHASLPTIREWKAHKLDENKSFLHSLRSF